MSLYLIIIIGGSAGGAKILLAIPSSGSLSTTAIMILTSDRPMLLVGMQTGTIFLESHLVIYIKSLTNIPFD